MAKPFEKVRVMKLPIRLGQFLKLANLVQDGIEASMKIQEGQVLVNDLLETRRGRKLFLQDTVTIDGETWVVSDTDEY